jgi:uncharacterized protein (TIGR03790 family)
VGDVAVTLIPTRCLIAALAILLFVPSVLHAQLSLNQRVLVVYNSGNSASTAVANYYASQRSIPTANLCPINPPSTTSLTWSQYVSSVKTPIRNCLTTIGPQNILYIVFTYMTPFTVNGSTSPFYYALDQYVADIWDQYAQQDSYPAPAQVHPYYYDAQSMGNVYQPFVSFASYRAQHGALSIYSVWRLDGATQALAQGLVDKAIAAESSGLAGQVCIDRNRGAITGVLDSDYGEGDWDLHQAATFSGQAGFTVVEDPNAAEFGTAPAPLTCPNAALYSGWYTLNHYNNVFTWNTGAIGFHLDSASALNPRTGPNWSANAIINGITVTTGSVNEPYLQGLVRPGGVFRDLFQGANLGDAFLRNTRWLKWMILYLGDPLYRPFPNGIAPFNPPPPQYSLALSSRYVLNGARPTGTVTLPNPAPVGGTVVNLSSSMTSLVTVPASVTVPGGSTTATFTVTAAATPPVTSDTPVRITASGVGQNTLTVSPLLGGLFISPSAIIGGALASGMVFLNFNAGPGGATVALSSNTPSINVPATVTVPQGTSQATFAINSSYVTSATTGTVTATLLGAAAHSSLTLYPALSSLSVSPSSVPGGANATLVIYLGANAPAGGWPVNLSSSNPAVASLPATVTVPAGTRYLQVPVTTFPQCTNTPVTLTASSGLSTLNTTLTVTPPPPTSLSFVSSVRGGTPVTATVYVSYPACSSGLSVALQSSNPSVANVPGSVTIPGGQKSATFIITTFSVSTTTSVNISATSDNVTKSRVLTVTP